MPARKGKKGAAPVTPPHVRKMRADLAAAEQAATAKAAKSAGKKTRAKKGAKASKAADAAEDDKAQVVEDKEMATVNWAKDHALTDHILTIVEDNEYYRTALGFVKGEGEAAGKTLGKKINDHCLAIANTVLRDHPSELWKDAPPDKLTSAMRNRINGIKTTYRSWHGKLKETGQGLVKDDESVKAIVKGSVIDNYWKAIQARFPWYRRMDDLMGRSPIVDTTAISNAASKLNLSLLDRQLSSDDMDLNGVNADENELKGRENSTAPGSPDSHVGSPSFDVDSPFAPTPSREATPAPTKIVEADVKPARTKGGKTAPATLPAPPVPTATAVVPQKRKATFLDKIADIADADRKTREGVAQFKIAKKEDRKTEKEKLAYQLECKKLEVESKRLEMEQAAREHEAREKEKQRAHERQMMEHRMEMQRMSAHSLSTSTMGVPLDFGSASAA